MNLYLKNIVSIQSGIYCPTVPDGDTYYLQVKDFDTNGTLSDVLQPSISYKDKQQKHLLQKGDLLFASKGITNFCTIYNMEADKKAVASSAFFVLRMQSTNIRPAYISWFLNLPATLQMLRENERGRITPIITKSMIEELSIPIPSIEVQDIIININQLQEKEEELHKAIYSRKKILTNKLLIKAIK